MGRPRYNPGQVALWRLEQARGAVKSPSATLLDLYLSHYCQAVLPPPFDHQRETRSPHDLPEIGDADLVLCTHDHLDHLDPPTVRTLSVSSPDAQVVATVAASYGDK